MVSYVFQGDERPQLYTVVWRGRSLARLVVLSEALPKGQIELGYHAAGAASPQMAAQVLADVLQRSIYVEGRLVSARPHDELIDRRNFRTPADFNDAMRALRMVRGD